MAARKRVAAGTKAKETPPGEPAPKPAARSTTRVRSSGATSAGERRATTATAKAKSPTRATTATAKAKSPTRGATAAAKPPARRKKKMAPPLETLERLRVTHPDARCELEHEGAFQLLVATVLSAQTTDVNVNKATPALFARFPDARALGGADPKDVEPYISTLGFFRQKTKSIVGLSKLLVERHGGEVPRTLGELVELPGVGRKTANVVLGVMWNAPEGVVVDTHVQRVSQRLGWSQFNDPAKIEKDLMRLIPQENWDEVAHLLIFHGRRVCFARKPNCAECSVNDICPSAFHAENVGRKPKRLRVVASA